MNQQIYKLEQYLLEVLGLQIRCEPWKESERLPHFLRSEYNFYLVVIHNVSSLALLDQSNSERTPGTIAKHIDRIRSKWDGPVIYVREALTSYNRKRLIEHKIPFIVPNNQMYIPDLGMDLREQFKQIRANKPKATPASQAIFLFALLDDRPAPEFTTSQLAGHFEYSSMTFSRVFDELSGAQLANIRKKGRHKVICFDNPKKQLWKEAQPWLRSPVKKTEWISKSSLPEKIWESGITALSRYSMIAEPPYTIYAVFRDTQNTKDIDWKNITTPYAEPDSSHLEFWMYDPGLLSKKSYVDPLSLYLSLRNDDDERIQNSLNEMMEQMPW